jgi:acyl-CoA-binding protein
MAAAPRKNAKNVKENDLKTRFEAAAVAAKKARKKPGDATLLKLYSYYKQATEGDVKGARPGIFDFVGGAKYDAWAKLKGTTAEDAMTNYIKQVEKLDRD